MTPAPSSTTTNTAVTVFCALVFIPSVMIFLRRSSSLSCNNADFHEETKSSRPTTSNICPNDFTNTTTSIHTVEIPRRKVSFFYYPPSYYKAHDKSEPAFSSLARSIESYRNEASKIISTLQEEEEITLDTEFALWGQHDCDSNEESHCGLLSKRIREKITKMAQLMESDAIVLEQLLQPFDVVHALPNISQQSKNDKLSNQNDIGNDSSVNNKSPKNPSSTERRWTSKRKKQIDIEATSTYDSAVHVITHVTRDWTNAGQEIRQSLYIWCVQQVMKYHAAISNLPLSSVKVLVPGAALGRLAHEISIQGFTVEANDCSLTMAAAANQLLHGKSHGVIHPYTFDFFVNEIDVDRRYTELQYPDCEFISTLVKNTDRDWGDLSYTLGDFVEIYTTSERKHSFHLIVTCFFIDTATNVYEYLSTIHHLLRPNGIWINVGPLQWHRNAQIRPSAQDLHAILKEQMQYDILLWEMDKQPLQYRSDEDGNVRYTKMEAYFPLRFVVRKTENGTLSNGHENRLKARNIENIIFNNGDDDSPSPGIIHIQREKDLLNVDESNENFSFEVVD